MATELGRTGRRCDRVAKKKRKRRRPISRRRTALHQSKRDHGVPVVRLSPSLGTVLPFIFQLEWCVSSLCGSIARHFIVNGGKKKLLSDLTKKGNWKLRVAGNRRGSQSIDVFEIDWRGWPESVSFSRFCLRLFVCFFFVVLRPVKVGRPRRRNGRRLHGQAEPFSAAADGGEFRSWTPSASASSSKEEDRRWLSCSVDPRGRPPPQKKKNATALSPGIAPARWMIHQSRKPTWCDARYRCDASITFARPMRFFLLLLGFSLAFSWRHCEAIGIHHAIRVKLLMYSIKLIIDT